MIYLLISIAYPQSNQHAIQELNAQLNHLDEILNTDSLEEQTLQNARKSLQESYLLSDKATIAKAHGAESSVRANRCDGCNFAMGFMKF